MDRRTFLKSLSVAIAAPSIVANVIVNGKAQAITIGDIGYGSAVFHERYTNYDSSFSMMVQYKDIRHAVVIDLQTHGEVTEKDKHKLQKILIERINGS